MARAYIVLARNDLDDNLLQALDLKPNSSQMPPGLDPDMGQTGYLTHYLIDGVNAAVTTDAPGAAGGVSADFAVADSPHYGLSAYLLDVVEDTGGNQALTAAEAVQIAGLIEAAVAAGTALDLATINTYINTPAGVAGSDLDGTLGNSTGTVEEILRILAGERYRVVSTLGAEAEVQNAAGNFVAARRGAFVTRPNVLTPDTVQSDLTGLPVRGRASTAPFPYIRPGEPRAGNTPVQVGTEDVNFNDVRQIVDTGDLHLSATDGVLADLKAATFAYENPAFTYDAAGTALTLGGVNILAGGVARAISVYAADGTVI
jgi:hypothetical protein